jgi:uncharacterized protein with PIN domain
MLFRIDDHASLAKKLRLMFADVRFRDSVAIAGRALVRREYSAKIMATKYAELYVQLAGREPKSDPKTEHGTRS